jgi:predicted dehydrogenase
MIRIGLIGSGPIAALHAAAFRALDGVELTICASRSYENAERFRAMHGFREARTIDSLLDSPDVDGLVVVVPAISMAEVATRAAATGLPLLMEKPVGMSLAETQRVSALVTQPNIVGLNRRFYEVLQKGKRMVDDAGGVRFIEVHMPEDTKALESRYDRATLDAWHFGNSIHLVDLFRYFGGEVSNVTTNNEVHNHWDRSYSSLISFESGARGVFNAQWYAPGPWRVAVYADDLCLMFAPIEQGVAISSPGRRREDIIATGPDTKFKPGFHGQARAFVSLIGGSEETGPAADLKDYLGSVDLMDKLSQVVD